MSGLKFVDKNGNLIVDAYATFGQNMIEGRQAGSSYHEIISKPSTSSQEIKNYIKDWSGGIVPKYEDASGNQIPVDLTSNNHPQVKIEKDKKGNRVGIVLSEHVPPNSTYLLSFVDEIAIMAISDKVKARNMLYGMMLLTRCM